MFSDLIGDKAGMPEHPPQVPSAEESFHQMIFTDDMWQDAEMASVCHYLRGGKNLQIPENFRPYLPKRLWSSLLPKWYNSAYLCFPENLHFVGSKFGYVYFCTDYVSFITGKLSISDHQPIIYRNVFFPGNSLHLPG